MARLRMLSAGRSTRIAPNMTRVMMSERSVATSEPGEDAIDRSRPIIADTAAIFLTGQSRASAGARARSARASQKNVPAASTMWRPEIDTMW